MNSRFVFALAVAVAAAAAPGQTKIDARLRLRAQSEAALPVFIVLKDQPQREIFRQAESVNALYRQIAESQETADAVLVRTRRQAFRAIEQAIGPGQDALESRLIGWGATRISRYRGVNMLTAEIPASAIDELESDAEVSRVFPVEKYSALLATSVPALGAPAFWNAGYTGQGVSVGILDTGLRTDHPAFAGVPLVTRVFLTNGSTDLLCFADDASSVEDMHGHGTHVAGIVASQGSPGWTNYLGVAKGLGTLYILKVGYKLLGRCGGGATADDRDTVAALDWALANTPVRIVNFSYGSWPNADDDDSARTMDQYMDDYGLLMTIAGGNAGETGDYGIGTPGIAYNSITAANWAERGVIAYSSSRGPTVGGRYKPDLAAPGSAIYSTAFDWNLQSGNAAFVAMTGTSMAAPHLAGAAALLESAAVTNPLAVKAILINTTDDEGWAHDRGWGFTNLNTAQAQMNYETGSLAAGDMQLYRLSPPGHARSTVTWNRHVSGGAASFNDINLYLCDPGAGTMLASSESTIQNVEQVAGTSTGETEVAVVMNSSPLAGVTSEPYAIAFNTPGVPLAGLPRIGVSCSGPPSVASGSGFTVACEVTNNGEQTADAVRVQATLPPGFAGAARMTFGDVQPGAVSSATLHLTAPAVADEDTIRFDASTLCGLVTATASVGTRVVLALPAPAQAAPPDGASGLDSTVTLSWSASAGATSYDVYLGLTASPPLVATTAGNSYTAANLIAGAVYYWRIVAKNAAGGSSSATWSFTIAAAPEPREYTIATVLGRSQRLYVNRPWAVAVDTAGSLYIVDDIADVILKAAPDGSVTTVAGGGAASNLGDGGPAVGAYLRTPKGAAVDGAGNLYIAETNGHRIRKVTPDGIITTVAGDGIAGNSGDGGPATSAQLYSPSRVTTDAGGDLYISGGYYPVVRKVGPDGTITTEAGGVVPGYSGDGGPAISAQLDQPSGTAADAAGNLYIADSGNNRIRRVAPDGTIATVAGNGTKGYSGDGGPAVSAELDNPRDVAVDAAGDLFIADRDNFRIREVTPSGTISTIAGDGYRGYTGDGGPATGARLDYVASIAATPRGDVYLTDPDYSAIRVLVLPDATCQFAIDQAAFTVPATGGALPVSIRTEPVCLWRVSGLPFWITSSDVGVGDGEINLQVQPNVGGSRTATVSVAGVAVTVTQADSSCAYALDTVGIHMRPAGGTGRVNVTTGSACPWTASSSLDWVTFTGPVSGVGSGSVSYSVAPNSGANRWDTVTVAGYSVWVQQSGLSASGLRFVAVAPCRVADTRYGAAPSLGGGSSRSFDVPGSGCGIPSSAQAYSLNVTVVPKGPRLSYLTLWPSGQEQPFVSTLNSWQGNVVANAAIVPAGFNGAVSVYATDSTDVILDINGYFDIYGANAFYPVQPCRVADTRYASGPSLAARETRDFAVPASGCGLPATAGAYSMNATVVPGGYLGYLTTWPAGQPQPNVSTLNSWTGKVVANAAIVPAASDGSISVYASNPTAVILDANGYFGAPGGSGALNFYPVAPCRVADTRGSDGPFGGPILEAASTRSFPIPSSGCGIPATAQAYSLNVTVVPAGVLSYLTTWPAGAAQPLVSTLNSWDGTVVANGAIVPAGAGGAISVYVTNRTHVILDINGYFAP